MRRTDRPFQRRRLRTVPDTGGAKGEGNDTDAVKPRAVVVVVVVVVVVEKPASVMAWSSEVLSSRTAEEEAVERRRTSAWDTLPLVSEVVM